MKTTQILIITAVLLIHAVFATRSSAGVIIQFEEIGGNVVATTSGSFEVPSLPPDGSFVDNAFYGSDVALIYRTAIDYWTGGNYTPTGLLVSPTSASGDAFGYLADFVYLPTGVAGPTFSPLTTWTWSGETLASIGLSSLSATPTVVYERSGETISFAAVPEPATTALFVSGAVAAFAALRRRKR